MVPVKTAQKLAHRPDPHRQIQMAPPVYRPAVSQPTPPGECFAQSSSPSSKTSRQRLLCTITSTTEENG